MRRGETLRDAALTSPNGRYELVCSDGRFRLREDGASWSPGPDQPSGTGLHVDADGELQYRSAEGKAWPMIPDFDHMKGRRKRWPTGPKGTLGPAREAHALIVRDDGDIDLVDVNDRTMWSFDTARHARLLREFRAMSIERPTDTA